MTSSSSNERESLRATFDEVPDLYDRARPEYPRALFDDLVSLAQLPARARLLEIGCGTGKATVPLAERGFAVVCVELGARLAAVARRNLSGFPTVEVIHAPFEEWEPERADFHAVVAFTAFHWLDPVSRFERCARLLRPHGTLAVVDTKHVLPPGGDRFWVDVQEDYDAVVPDPANAPPPPPDDVAGHADEFNASGLFDGVVSRRYVWPVTYTPDEYIGVLETYSGHRSMPEAHRMRLYERIRRRLAAREEHRVTKHYLATLDLAQVSERKPTG